jgi:predicted transcriptional regulator
MTRTSDVDKVRLRELWEEGESVADIAEELGITTSSVYKISIADNFPRREDGRKPKADPTIEEIYAAAAAIRATTFERMKVPRNRNCDTVAGVCLG